MALFRKLVTFAKSPQGRRALAQAQKAARDPQNRERLARVRTRIQKRRAGADPARSEPGASGSGDPRS